LTLNRYENGQWTDPEQRWEVGEGVVLLNPSEDGIRLTFTGGIPQGEIKTPIPRGLSLQGSKVPQSGGLTSDLRLAAGPGDQVFLWNGKSFSEFRSLPGGEWFPREPVLFVGQSFFIFAHEPLNWDREFAVNPVGATGN
jgi:hypothetical protein